MSLAAGSKLGPYQIAALLGAGGMGMVYRARDARLERDVAIKILPPGLLTDESARKRFRKEGLALAKLSHPNIAAVYDVGEADGIDYIVMECVPGQSLATLLSAGPLPVERALALSVQVAAALEEAHEQGVVHRDLKPANILVTPKGQVKVLDFGIAKLLAPPGSDGAALSVTETQGPIGTPLYMSPEQASGEPVDARSDLWSLGVVLFESLTGRAPFGGAGPWALLRAITHDPAPSLRDTRPEIPRALEGLVSRALTKDVTRRYQTAGELSRDLGTTLTNLRAPAGPANAKVGPRVLVPAVLAIALVGTAAGWFYLRSEHRHWAREVAVPTIPELRADRRSLAAFLMLARAKSYLPADSTLARIEQTNTRVVSIGSSPAGATVEIQDYMTPDSGWYRLGTTPISRIRMPRGYFRWRVTRAGTTPLVIAPLTGDSMMLRLDSIAAAPPGMVAVDAGQFETQIDFVGWIGPYNLPRFYLDRYEVTNREYQRFVDSGGYQRREYWTEPFRRDGTILGRDQAMALLRDRTDRPGPSTWEGGHFPTGQADYPVSGISWFEASAYAAYAGKSLPTFSQWYQAAPDGIAHYVVHTSNIGQSKMAPVGAFKGVGPFGTYDMVGNVREWARNSYGTDRRFILGGAWNSQTYLAAEPEALSPFDRSPTNGFRCLRNLAPLPDAAIRPVKGLERDFAKVKPASDDVFRAYRSLYDYEARPLNARVDSVVEDTPDWRKEKVSFDAAYGSGRVPAFLFLPKRVKPPYQTVVFFPSARVLYLDDSRSLGDMGFIDYVIQSGRAVLYPVYLGTYERQVQRVVPGASKAMDITVDTYKDLARSVEYLETRADVDTTRLGYLGVSWGAADGVLYATLLQEKFRTVVFLDGGFFLGPSPPGRDQANFAPRLTKPVLMVNGRYDFSFSYEKAQLPLFQMLGAPAADKQHVVLDTPHDVRAQRPEMVKAVLGWLDRYLGRVQ